MTSPASLWVANQPWIKVQSNLLLKTYAPALAAACASLIVSLVLEPPTPATMGMSVMPALSSVRLMKVMRATRSSGDYDS